MPILLEEILVSPALAPAHPILRAGFAQAGTSHVRWVHSSEVLDIATLLHGDELLLTGGTNLVTVPPEQQIEYVVSLAKRKIAALAIETGSLMPSLPAEIIHTAQAEGLPLVELRKVVPFVDVAQTINSMLVGESATRLQRADVVSHTIATELAEGHRLDQLLTVLSRMISADVTLTGMMGNLLGAASFDDGTPKMTSQGIDIELPVRGSVAGNLHIDVPVGGDGSLARVAGERASDILALAMLWEHPPTLRDTARAELFRAITADGPPWRIPQLCSAAGLDWGAPVVAVVIRPLGVDSLTFRLGGILSKPDRIVLTYSHDNEELALVILPHCAARRERAQLLSATAEAIAGHNCVAALGPLAHEMGGAADSLAEARLTLDLTSPQQSAAWPPPGTGLGPRIAVAQAAGTVIDAESVAVERFTWRNIQPETRASFVHSLLSELIKHDGAHGGRLLESLSSWLDHGCNATEAARGLHVERQSMHNRLNHIFDLIGGDPRGTARLAGLQMATRMAQQFPPSPPATPPADV